MSQSKLGIAPAVAVSFNPRTSLIDSEWALTSDESSGPAAAAPVGVVRRGSDKSGGRKPMTTLIDSGWLTTEGESGVPGAAAPVEVVRRSSGTSTSRKPSTTLIDDEWAATESEPKVPSAVTPAKLTVGRSGAQAKSHPPRPTPVESKRQKPSSQSHVRFVAVPAQTTVKRGGDQTTRHQTSPIDAKPRTQERQADARCDSVPVQSRVRRSRPEPAAEQPHVDVNSERPGPSLERANDQDSHPDQVSLRTLAPPPRRAGLYLWVALGVATGIGLVATLSIMGARPAASWLAKSVHHGYAATQVVIQQAQGFVGVRPAHVTLARPLPRLSIDTKQLVPAAPSTPAMVTTPTTDATPVSVAPPAAPQAVRTNAVRTPRRTPVVNQDTQDEVPPSASAPSRQPLHPMTVRQSDDIDTSNPY